MSSSVYFPSPLPTTRLSISTSALPVGASQSNLSKVVPSKASTSRNKGKYKESLAGLIEEEGEEVISIVKGIEPGLDEESNGLWAVLGREEVSIWSIRPKVVLAKLRRTPVSLRLHGSNALITFRTTTQFVITTTLGHQLLYYLTNSTSSSYSSTVGSSSSLRKGLNNSVYILPGGEKGNKAWPKGPGEGKELDGIIIRSEGDRGMNVGDGVGCVCVTPKALLVSVIEPPSLRIIPFPTLLDGQELNAESQSKRRLWENLAPGLSAVGESILIHLKDWDWLTDRENVYITKFILLDSSPQDNSSSSSPTHFNLILLTSDGNAYQVRWGRSVASLLPINASNPDLLPPIEALNIDEKNEKEQLLFDERTELELEQEREEWIWSGVCFHSTSSQSTSDGEDKVEKDIGKEGSCISVNERMSLIAVGCQDGTISVYNFYPITSITSSTSLNQLPPTPTISHVLSLRKSLNSTATSLNTGQVTCLSWTSDGYALATGWELGYSIWSVYGRLGSWSVVGSLSSGYGVEGEKSDGFEDHFLQGVRNLFWSVGNLELFVLCPGPVHPKKKAHDEQLFVIPFAKSAVTGLHTPDNTKHAFLQMDDRVLVYRGADQPDMSVINPESDVWQHIKLPASYIALHHPIKYAAISSDSRLIAVAGKRGLTHYNASSGRWKLFESEEEEEEIRVSGGMTWWGNVLIVACFEGENYQIRLFSRDKPLALADSLDIIYLESEPLLLSVFDSSLLVYTADNTFHHFLIRQTVSGITTLRACGSIGFEGVVADPTKVRGMSWLVPKSQQRFGDPADDLNVATIIFLINGKLVLLRPRRAIHEEVKYDMQILADRIEFYWSHLSGIGTLENSLWGWDGKEIRIWLDALTIEKIKVNEIKDAYESVEESVGISLDFYPLAVLMDKGIIVGVDQETSLRRSLDFAIFRIITTTQLFIHHVLRFHLNKNQRKEAVLFASYYQHLIYFPHALEILLHAVLEEEADARPSRASSRSSTPLPSVESVGKEGSDSAVLPRVIEFLDHFDEALQVVVGCARKTEVARWSFLFDVVGKPRDLFEKCIAAGYLKVAASYLLVLHNLETIEQSSKDTVRLLKSAMDAGDWTLCRELLRFLYSLDRSGAILETALSEGDALPPGYSIPEPEKLKPNIRRAVSVPLMDRAISPSPLPLSSTSPPTPIVRSVSPMPIESLPSASVPTSPERVIALSSISRAGTVSAFDKAFPRPGIVSRSISMPFISPNDSKSPISSPTGKSPQVIGKVGIPSAFQGL